MKAVILHNDNVLPGKSNKIIVKYDQFKCMVNSKTIDDIILIERTLTHYMYI